MKTKLNILSIVSLIIAMLGLSMLLVMLIVDDGIKIWMFGIVVIILIAFFFYNFLLEKQYPRAFNVAIIGFPKTGKTTLITVLLCEILFHRIKRCHAIIKGEITINKVNENLRRLKDGKPVGATTDETKFAYRTNISTGKGIFTKEYKIEFGDFPGECSEQFSAKSLNWLKDTSFFNWAVEADAFFFVIDVSICFLPDDKFSYTINDIDAGYRSAWQHIVDANPFRTKKIRSTPISIIFTKSDIVNVISDPEFFSDNRDERIELIRRNKDVFEKVEKLSGINDENIIIPIYNGYQEINNHVEQLKTVVANDFRDLISFFKSENPAAKVIFTSAFYSEQNNEIKLGIEDVFNSIIPK
jgi:hypothetical protein